MGTRATAGKPKRSAWSSLLSTVWNGWGAIFGWLAQQTAAGLVSWLVPLIAFFALVSYALLRKATVCGISNEQGASNEQRASFEREWLPRAATPSITTTDGCTRSRGCGCIAAVHRRHM